MSKNKNNLENAFKSTMKKHKGNIKAQIITIIVFGLIALGSYLFGNDFISNNDIGSVTGQLEVSYLDVGQGDAIYVKVNDYDVLIDAGPRSDAEKLMSQLEEKNIDDFEILIATHPHEDHIGGMTDVLKKYNVENFYMPKVSNTTKTFEYMINAISDKGLKLKTIKDGTSIDLGSGSRIDVYSPIDDVYDDFNDYSPIMKLTYGETKLMFTGDAEELVEKQVLQKYPSSELKSDVLKFGHHGSSTSSSEEFLNAVSPTYGVISCAVDNEYGHPHKETLEKIKTYNIDTYRTDTQGQIQLLSDGKNIVIQTEK
ncbi:MAG: MBL fold metallo-hydrolase [Clostridium butyricum]|nr:MBL fold metallo-hydrolase [Clostridium butyricum]